MSTLKYLLIIALLLLALAGTVFLTLRVVVFSNRAATGNSSPVALANSYLFASPLQAKADNQEKIRLTVFLLDGRGLGVPNQRVSVTPPAALTLTAVQATSDDTGKAVFDLSSSTAGTYSLEAKTDSGTLPQKVRVTFY